MTPDSQTIQDFIQHTPLFQKMPTLSLSRGSINQLLLLLSHIRQGHKMFKKTEITVKRIPSSTIEKIHNVIPSTIRQYIHTMIKNKDGFSHHIKFKIKHRDYELFIVHEGLSNDQLRERIMWIFCWLYLASLFAPTECSKLTHLHLYFTSFKKLLPEKSSNIVEDIDEFHANTAFTTSCRPQTSIHLFREEEWFKVLIHESFHNLGLDFSRLYDSTSVNNAHAYIRKLFPIQTDVNLFETYCEMWAEIINVLFVVYFENLQNKSEKVKLDSREISNRILDKLEIEQRFSLFQCIKVLHFYGMDYVDLYTSSPDSEKRRKYNYKESTNVLSYYILKSIFMFFLDDFLAWVRLHSGESIQFQPHSIHDYCLFIEKRYKDPQLLDTFSLLEKWIDSHHSHSWIMQTLRMSVHEL